LQWLFGSSRPWCKTPGEVLNRVLLCGFAAATAGTQLSRANRRFGEQSDGVHPGFAPSTRKAWWWKAVQSLGGAASSAVQRCKRQLNSVIARFSDGSGADCADGSPAVPRASHQVPLPSGADTDMVTNSFKFFPVGRRDFRDLLQAIVASPPDAPKPTKLDQFFASHSECRSDRFAPIPDSFADEEYHGIDAFILVNKSGPEAGSALVFRVIMVSALPALAVF